jgi:hypothetical protein
MATPNDGFKEFSFGSGDDNIGKQSKRFKGKEGETYRVSFVWIGKDEEGKEVVRFTGCERHYVPNVGYFLHKGPEYARLAGGPPKQAVATIIVVWPTDKNGKVNKEAFQRGEGFEVKPWIFSAEKFDQLRRRNEEHPLDQCDLTMACTEAQYQKMDISPCRESLFRKLAEANSERSKKLIEDIKAEVAEIEGNLRNDMARDLSLDKIREKMGGQGSTPASRGGGGAAENVDGLLDNLLDE